MRIPILFVVIFLFTSLKAQIFVPGSIVNNAYRGTGLNNITTYDSSAKKKWFVSKYAGISTSFTFFKGGNATIVSAPIGLQLNRKLNNNLYAFAGVSVAPAYINFNRSFSTADFNKSPNNSFFNPKSLSVYSRAELGLQYVNDERTFSISGSIGVERSSYPISQFNQFNYSRPYPIVPSNK